MSSADGSGSEDDNRNETHGPREVVTRAFRPAYQDSGLEFVTLRRKKTISLLWREREREWKLNAFPQPKYSSFLQRPPQQKRKPLLFTPTRKHRQKIYNTQGMCEERSAFIRTIFPTGAH